CRSPAAIDGYTQLRLVHFEPYADVTEIIHRANLVGDVLRRLVQRVEVLVLENQFERRITETDFNGFGQIGNRHRSLDLVKESLLHAARTVNNFLHGALALAVVFETDEDHSEVRLTRPRESRRHYRAEGFHFGHRCDDSFRL